MATWIKYLLMQIPGWLATGTVLTVLRDWQLLPLWLAVLCFAGWLLKDLMLYPLLRRSYEGGVKTGSAALVGARGVAQEDLNPSGYVRVRGELWRAVAVPADQVVTSGADVEIVQAERMTVFVRSVENLDRR